MNTFIHIHSYHSSPSQNVFVELIHHVFNVELHLSRLCFTQCVCSALSNKEIYPLFDNRTALKVSRQIWVIAESDLDVSNVWRELINSVKVQSKSIYS